MEGRFKEKFVDYQPMQGLEGRMDTEVAYIKTDVPYEILNFIRSEIALAEGKLRERIRGEIENELFSVVAPPEDAKDFMGDWERGVVTSGYSVKQRVLSLPSLKANDDAK